MASPFVTYRAQLDVYQDALSAGISDQEYVEVVSGAEAKLVASGATGFEVTPLQTLETPLDRPVLAKIETANVGGSHKARHLFGLLIRQLLADHAGSSQGSASSDQSGSPKVLAIASCGNAAVGAATLAHALDRRLRVFVPGNADENVMTELERLGAETVVCERDPNQTGDPTMAALAEALSKGAEAFTVQGTTCPDVIDGARTLGLELASQIADLPGAPKDIYIQIGGGALAGATMDGLARGGVNPLPRLHPVQSEAVHPYMAAWDRLQKLLGQADPRLGLDEALSAEGLMQPWPGALSSLATGIIDDVTYDWQSVARYQVATEGWSVKVAEEAFVRATELGAGQVFPPPDATGTAGLAGLLTDPRASETQASALVLITGVDREWQANQT